MWPWGQIEKHITSREIARVTGFPKREREREITVVNSSEPLRKHYHCQRDFENDFKLCYKTIHLFEYVLMSCVDKGWKASNFTTSPN